jgi:hypothetical protein
VLNKQVVGDRGKGFAIGTMARQNVARSTPRSGSQFGARGDQCSKDSVSATPVDLPGP